MQGESLVQLAIQISQCLQGISAVLCADIPCVQFCSRLSALLANILQWLQTLSLDEDDAQDAVYALLEQLQSIFPATGAETGAKYPSSDEEQGAKHRYEAISRLLNDADAATLAVRNLATGRRARERRTLLAWLGSFLPQGSGDDDKIDISPSNLDLQAASTEPLDCGKQLTSLYKTLYTHCSCDEADELVARVRLRNSKEDDAAKVKFDVLFMAHPHHDGTDLTSQPLWQHTHISVLQTVQFNIDTNAGRQEICPDSDMPFCAYISAHDEYGFTLLEFSVTEHRLFYEHMFDPAREWAFDKPSISLGCILNELHMFSLDLTEKRKEVLSWLLAKAVWQYYSSPWMRAPWNKDIVHFLFERQSSSTGGEDVGIFVNEPFLSFSICPELDVEKPGDAKPTPKRRLLPFGGQQRHQRPKILALGIMLVEIQLGKAIETLHAEPEWAQYCPRGVPNLTTNYKICRDLVAKDDFFTDISTPLEKLIRNCIIPNDLFLPSAAREDDDVREALYTLVNALEVYLSQRKPDVIRPLTIAGNMYMRTAPAALSKPLPIRRNPPPVRQQRASISGRTMMQRSTSISTKDWFARMESLNIILKAGDGDTKFRKVKIAVIDTGVDANDAAAAIVSGYHDFVGQEHGVKRDNTGHGTTSVNLISGMCEEAEIYALRVFEMDEANDKTRQLAIKAIEWCITEEMDIICMTCGFYQSDRELFGKIHEASGNMLIFAAPTNDSNAGDIAYPAQHDAEVFGIFSTNGAITSSQHLNPSKGPGQYNFAILGEDIMTYTGKEVSGTSLATALAAGLAGQLLEVSRHRDCRIRNGSTMSLKHGMTKVLMAMAVPNSNFYCLKPWMLLPKELRGLLPFIQYPSEAQIQEAREHICNVITLALAEM